MSAVSVLNHRERWLGRGAFLLPGPSSYKQLQRVADKAGSYSVGAFPLFTCWLQPKHRFLLPVLSQALI